MRILLMAHEFPPGTSPQALRWARLAAGLASRGHRVTTLTTLAHAGAKETDGDIRVVRTSPGRLHEAVRAVRRALRPRHLRDEVAAELPVSTTGLNWRGRIVALATAWAGILSFPDLRAHWTRGALAEMRRLVAQERPDIAITSHEPASVLQLGFAAQALGIPWVADLGDPVLAPYTPRRWRWHAARLERRVCRSADLVLVTTEAYRDALVEVHGLDPERCEVLRQGFDDASGPASDCAAPDLDPDRMELLFAGQFYPFRRPESLLEALASVEGVRFTVISPRRDPALVRAEERLGGKLRLLGPLPHRCVAAWQSRADVLVNFGNRLPLQIPGKLFEYFGMGRSILHLSPGEPDESAKLVRERKRGWVVRDDPDAVKDQLQRLLVAWRLGGLETGLDLTRGAVVDFSWSSLATRLEASLEATLGRFSRRTKAQ